MELHWPHANSGKHGAAGEGFSIGDSRTIAQILERNPEDDFECTYFRRRTNRTPITMKKGGGLFPMTVCYTPPSELSEGYTDSDSESDNTSNVERWLESLPTNDAWSSVPNYSALDGSKGLEGVDEIQEDGKKSAEEDSGTCPNSTDDSRRSLTSGTDDLKAGDTEDDLVKRVFARRDKISVMAELLDRQAPRKKMKRTLKTRCNIPFGNKVERQTRNLIANKKENRKTNDLSLASTVPIYECYQIPGNNTPDDKTAMFSNTDTLETTEHSTAMKKPSPEEEGYDEMMQEMVQRLLTVSGYPMADQNNKKPKIESLSKATVKDLKELYESNEPRETEDSNQLHLETKRITSSTTFNELSPKLASTRINGNQLPKRTQVMQKVLIKENRNQKTKRRRKIAQRKKSSIVKPAQLNSVQKIRYVFQNPPIGEGVDATRRKEIPSTPQSLRTVRFQDEMEIKAASEDWRKIAMVKAARNKRILQKVEQIVDNIKSEEFHCLGDSIIAEHGGVQKKSPIPVVKLMPKDSIVSKNFGVWKNNRKRTMPSIENQTIVNKKPIFTNPMIENCLDKAMEVALNKYKYPENTWENFIENKIREKTSVTAYEPPAKKQKPKTFVSKLENVQRQDFSLLNSWQAIHEYFLSQSSCK